MSLATGGIDEIARELADTVAHIVGTESVAVYLRAHSSQGAHRLEANAGGVRFVDCLEPESPLSQWLYTVTSPDYLPGRLLAFLTTPALPTALVVPVRWRTRLLGFVALGSISAAEPDAEDLGCVVNITDQAAASIMAVSQSAVVRSPDRGTPDPLIAAAVHDIKNSLSALSMLTRNAVTSMSDPEFQRDTVTTLSRTVDRLRRLLDTLSTTFLKAPTVRLEPIDLRELITEATTTLAAHRKVRLVRRLDRVDALHGDREALLRVVENLATNAAEAIEREGTVTVTLTEVQGNAVITVTDTGCGIPPEHQEHHLFSPFHSTKQGGWGLGLYQTKQAVESQDGEILVESVVGHGTTFTVKLPLQMHRERSSRESVR